MGRGKAQEAQGMSGADVSPHTDALPPCELRRVERIAHGRAVVCSAADVVLGVLGRDDADIAAVCRVCPVPEALTDRWACLHLRPIHLLRDGQWHALFSCRWFYRLNPRRQPRSLQQQCYGCPYWFPRPDVALIPGYREEKRHIRVTVAEALALTSAPLTRLAGPALTPGPSPARGRGAAEGRGEGLGRGRTTPAPWKGRTRAAAASLALALRRLLHAAAGWRATRHKEA